jgi:diguanylate cyclase (GGDEF)-like protein/PAS domain S-box-containing protein
VSLNVAEHLRRSSDAFVLLDERDVVVWSTPRARAVLATDGLVGLDLAALYLLLGTGDLGRGDDVRTASRLVAGESRHGDRLDVVALPTDIGLAFFVSRTTERVVGTKDPGAELMDRVLSSVRDAVLVTIAEPVHGDGPVIVYANEALVHHTGYSLDELLGRSPRMLQGPGTDRAELDRLRAALEAWQPVTVELLNYRKDGTEFWVEIDITPIADANGWFTHWVSVQRVITHRKREEIEKEKRRAFVQAVLDSLPMQTAMLDTRGWIAAVNQPWRDFWTGGDASPEPIWSTVNYLEVCRRSADLDLGQEGMDARRAYDGIRAVLLGRSAAFSLDYLCPVDGVDRWFHLQAHPIRHSGGGVVITHTDITERKSAEAALSHQATHDALTGLPNRDLLRHRLLEQLIADRADARLTAVIYLDLDNFKDVNDVYGHETGDRLLDEVGERLRSLIREGDTVARLGGDEYVVVLGGLRLDWDALEFFERLREVVGQPLDIGAVSVRPSVSAGVVTTPPHDIDPEAVLRDADMAMYASKREGRDRCTVFSPVVRDAALARALTEERLSRALSNDLFVLHYQPIVDIETGTTVGSEALLRLQAPDGRLLVPGEFLATVDNGPLASEVGLWVLDHALAQQATWLRHDSAHRMSINVSPRQLGHGLLPGQVAELLARHGVPAESVVLELTEEGMVEVGGRAAPELAALRALGVRLAVDDFGTGYSALSYLRGFFVDVLKIDRVFLDSDGRTGGEPLLRAIVALAAAVDATAIAEGVETMAQLEAVRRVRVHRIQGHLTGYPAPPGDRPAAPLVDVRTRV